jgi:hypothetical protein
MRPLRGPRSDPAQKTRILGYSEDDLLFFSPFFLQVDTDRNGVAWQCTADDGEGAKINPGK